jgi:DNA polymerase-3 subunit epsilon/ATP-dependent DNA helicase DinG
VIDEAHHLEEVATEALGFRAGETRVRDALRALEHDGRGLLARLDAATAASDVPADKRAKLGEAVGELRATALRAAPAAHALFEQLGQFLADRGARSGEGVRLTPAARHEPAWLAVEAAWDELHLHLGDLRTGLLRLGQAVGGQPDSDAGGALAADLVVATREIAEIDAGLHRVVSRPAADLVTWATAGQGGRATIEAAPLHVGPTLATGLFQEKDTLVLTSATLRTGEAEDGFGFVRDRLGLPEAPADVVASPFDYARTTLVCAPADVPPPGHPAYQRALDQMLVALARRTRGRILVLFTSHSALRTSYHAIRGPLGEAGVAVLGQGMDGGRRSLIERFREPEMPTVLLGTRSFWEGVDLPGEALSCLVLTRLPFDVPSDPIFEARSEMFDDPFGEYAVPQAVLRFRQGFGRLIRTAGDRGAVVVADSRVRTKGYGARFLDALPACRRHDGPMHTVADRVARFLADDPLLPDDVAPDLPDALLAGFAIPTRTYGGSDD